MRQRPDSIPDPDALPGGAVSTPDARGWRERLVTEIREHPMAYVVLAGMVAAGPLVASALFPEAPTGVAIVGGLIFGVYAALCAVPQKFL